MNLSAELRTDRLVLRRWLPEDRPGLARLNADPRVVEFLPGALSQDESDALVDRIQAHFVQHQFGLWAVEIPGVARLAGFLGLAIPRFEAPFTPCVEIGWRRSTGTKATLRKALGQPSSSHSGRSPWTRSFRLPSPTTSVRGG